MKLTTVIDKQIHNGTFTELSEAVKDRWQAEKDHNFTNCNTTSSAYLYLKEHGIIPSIEK